MRDIRVYDFEFNLLCIMTDVVSVSWHILYNDIGTFEGHFRLSDNISNVILSNEYIVLVQGENQAICTGKIVNDELVVCGRTVNWILSKRVRPPFKTKDIFGEEYQNPETILLYCLEKGFIKPSLIDDNGFEIDSQIDENKKVNNFIIPTPVGAEKLNSHFWRISANELSKITADLCEKLNRGHRVVFDVINKQWVFEFIFPKENNIIISVETRTAYDMTLTSELLDYSSGGWYFNEDSDVEESKDKWHYIKKDDKKGIYNWDSVINCSGQSEAEDALSSKQNKQTIETKLKNLHYGKDYTLGDILSVYYKISGFEKLSYYMVTGVDIKMTPTQSYEEPILKFVEER